MRGALDYSPPPHLEAGRSASRLEEESPPFKIGEVNRNRSTVPRENSKEALQRVASDAVLEESMKEEKKHKYANELRQQVFEKLSLALRWSTTSERRKRTVLGRLRMIKR